MGSNAINLGLNSANASSGNGIDVTSVVNQILDVERAPEKVWQQQQSVLTQQASALNGINASLTALQARVNALGDLTGEITAKSASSSQPTIVTATADPSAPAGAHTILVRHLATTSSYYTDPAMDPNAALNDGVVSFQVGSSPRVDIVIDSTHDNNTLSTLATYINDQNVGVTATIVNDASGSRLALVSNTSGSSGKITIAANTTTLSFQQSSDGTNASFSVDGIPLASAGNTVIGALPGVTLNLLSESATPVQLTVGPDIAAAKQAVSDFVAAYNAVIKSINAQFAYDSTTGQGGVLAGDSSLRSLQSSMLSDVTYAIKDNNGFVNLASLGVDMANDGTLTVDDAKLTETITRHFAKFQNFFQSAGPNGFAINFGADLTALTDTTQGVLNMDLAQNASTQKMLTQQISDFEDRLALREQQLIRQYSQVDALLRQFPMIMNELNTQLSTLSQNT
jgi:flagellar hook-associated protein 2